MATSAPAGGAITRNDKNKVVQDCGPVKKTDPVVNDQLNCFDPEKSTNRQFKRDGNILEIVQTESTDTVIITYSGPVIPPHLDVTRDYKVMPPAKGGGKYSYKVTYAPPEQPYFKHHLFRFIDLFTWRHPPTVYQFSHADLPQSIEVYAYNPDQWSLTYDPPPSRGYSLGAKLDNKDESFAGIVGTPAGPAIAKASSHTETFTLTKSSSKGGYLISEKTEREIQASVQTYKASLANSNLYATASGIAVTVTDTVKGPGNTGGGLSKAFAKSPPISLKRNGVLVDVDILQVIGVLINLKKSIQDLITLIKKFQSIKAGWYMDLSADFMDGKIQVDWGWREDKTWEAYYYAALSLELKLFSVEAEIGVGVEVDGAGAQLCAGINGELSYEIKPIERLAPSSKPTRDISLGDVTGSLTAGVYARVKAGSALSITAAGEAPIKVTVAMKWKESGEFGSDIELISEGLVVSFKVKGLVSFKPQKATLIEGGTLGSFHFPSEHVAHTEQYTTKDMVAEAIKSKFDDGWWPIIFYNSITYMEEGLFWGENKVTQDFDVASDTIAKLVAAKIWRDRDSLEMDADTIDGLAQSIRKACEQLGQRFGRDKVSLDQMRTYLNGPFETILKAAHSPAKLYRKSMGG